MPGRIAVVGPEPGVHYEQIHLFRATSDGPFSPQAEEVEEVRLVTRPELEALLGSGEPATPSLRWLAKRLFAHGW